MDAWAETILGWIKETPDITLNEMETRLREKGAKVSRGPLCRLLQRHGMTYKKRQGMQQNKSGKM